NEAIVSLATLAEAVAPYDDVQLRLYSCESLESLAGLENVAQLTRLTVMGSAISELPPLAGCTQLTEVSLSSCRQLSDISGLAGVTSLESLVIMGAPALTDLSPLADLPALRVLIIWRCPGLPPEADGKHESRDAVVALLSGFRT